MIPSNPYSVCSARHHFRNYLGIIRGFSEIQIEGIPQESSEFSHFIFMIETSDRIQRFIDRVLSSEEILKRNEWKQPFWINIEHDLNSILKSVEALDLINENKNNVQMKEDLLKIKGAGKEILSYSEDFLSHSFEDFP